MYYYDLWRSSVSEAGRWLKFLFPKSGHISLGNPSIDSEIGTLRELIFSSDWQNQPQNTHRHVTALVASHCKCVVQEKRVKTF